MSEAQTHLLEEEAADWRKRAQRFRDEEWKLHEQMLQAALELIRQFRKSPYRRASLSQIVRLFDLASTLARKACGLPLDGSAPERQPSPPSGLEFEKALQKIYGAEDSHKAPNARVGEEGITLNGSIP